MMDRPDKCFYSRTRINIYAGRGGKQKTLVTGFINQKIKLHLLSVTLRLMTV